MSHKRIMLVGCGHMGKSALGILARQIPTATFTVVDRSSDNLRAAVSLEPSRIVGHEADISKDRIDAGGYDVVVNFAGPFFLGSDRVARAALDAGAAYVDVCDDSEGTQTILSLDEEAKRAGVPLITGGGLSPGISNWMACSLLATHPRLDGIKVVWIVQEKDPGGLAVLRHMLHMTVAPCPTWIDGRMEYTRGFVPETAEAFVVPSPFNEVEAYDTAHPEPITLARHFPQLKLVQCKGSLTPTWANQAFSTLGRIGFGRSELKVNIKGVEVEPIEVLWRLLWERHNRQSARVRQSVTQINVIGTIEGKSQVMNTITDDSDMSRGTGLGMAAAVVTLLRAGAQSGAAGVEALDHRAGLEAFASLAMAEGAFKDGIIETRM